MAHATTSSSKRKGAKANRPGGLGGRSGRGGRRWARRKAELQGEIELGVHLQNKTPREIAEEVKEAAERAAKGEAKGMTPYRRAMTALSAYVEHAWDSMTVERRKQIERAKDEVRALFGRSQNTKGTGGPGKLRSHKRRR